MKEVLIVPPFPQDKLADYVDIDGYHFEWAKVPTEEQLSRAQIILGIPRYAWIASAPHLEWVQMSAAGSDWYRKCQDFATGRVILTNLSGAFGQSISEYVLTMVMMLYKHMHLFRDSQKLHRWQDEGRQDSPAGKRLLILGAGDIGTAVARLFRPFRCEIIGMRRAIRETPPEFDRIITSDTLDEELPLADIVVCALPETKQTHKLLNRERLALLNKKALLVNVGRGTLIDTDALADMLHEGLLSGAALDVTDPEPLPAEHPLWDEPNCIITPHATGGSFGHLASTEEKLREICRENLIRYREGLPLNNVVDHELGYRIFENRA